MGKPRLITLGEVMDKLKGKKMTEFLKMGQREAFEYWFSDGGKSPRAVERNGEGYKLMAAASAWEAWKAAYAFLGVSGRPSSTVDRLTVMSSF